jgi:hypothetical protein
MRDEMRIKDRIGMKFKRRIRRTDRKKGGWEGQDRNVEYVD